MSALSLQGFGNQTRREAGTWWTTARWWVQGVVWTAILNGLLAMMLWVLPRLEGLGDVGVTVPGSAAQFCGMAGLITAIGVVVTTQGVLVDEQRVGLLEWMLSKPLSRTALLAAKFVAHGGALLATLVLLPWLGVLVQLSAARDGLWPLDQWLAATALMGLVALFHLALVLALSALTWSRALIVALPLVGIIGTDLVVAFAPWAFGLLPWTVGSVAGPLLADGFLVGIGPILSATLLGSACLAVGAIALERKEL